ncbi:MAG: class I SAM-dependent methyltransferase [Nitrososphaerota archaeon]|jgi:SAM-dependent methyltransferase|nr:class I SAM-dependent methyltransferase [Nitrososphaerota archaeon]
MNFQVKTEVSMKQKATFRAFTEELALALHLAGMEFDPKVGGLVRQAGEEIGRVSLWLPWTRLTIILHYSDWEQVDTKIDFRFHNMRNGTRIAIVCSGLQSPLLRGSGEQFGWFTNQVAAPLLAVLSPQNFGDWLTDRTARRPTGAVARRGYRNPTHHRPNFGAILQELALTPSDRLLEIGCGGGALLHDALKSGCIAAGIDHSPEMVRLTRRTNATAIRDRRLEVRESDADSLPFGDSSFTCAVMTSVLGFLGDPVKTFKEVNRKLKPGGKLVVFSTSKAARGTIAAPEPMASRIRFYEDADLKRMAIEAGFSEARVERPDLSEFIKGSGIPSSDLQSSSTSIGQLLVARKGSPPG